MTGIYSIAGVTIQIESVYSKIHELCTDYATADRPDFSIHITQSEIDKTKAKAKAFLKRSGVSEKDIADAYVELFTGYRMIAEQMPLYGTFMFHASVIAVDDVCYAFTAKSGTGKSTHSALWRQLFGERAVMVNDDKPLIHVDKTGKATAYGTPWSGKHKLGNNISVPLSSVCFLERNEENWIREISRNEALPSLLQQISRPRDTERLHMLLDLVSGMKIRYFRMGCNISIDAAKMAYEAMSGNMCERTGIE